MFDERRYVPVLKWKQGEQKAIESLTITIKQGLTPLIEVAPIDWDFDNGTYKKTIDEHLDGFGEIVSRSWGIDGSVFVDLLYIEPNDRMASGQHPLGYVMDDLRLHFVKAIPVTACDRDATYNREVSTAHQQDGLGICIRLVEEDFDNLHTRIDGLLNSLHIGPTEVDLVIDYRHVDPDSRTRTTLLLTGLINSMPYLQGWRNIILCGTAIPKDLSEIGADNVGVIERTEWLIWKRLVQTNLLTRRPIFGDYGVAHPEPFEADPRLIRMSANIRYTGENKFIMFRGRDLRKNGYAQYYQLAAQVVAHPEYSGPQFSAGDHYIYEAANQVGTSGSPQTWRRAGTNHHWTYVVNDLSNVTLP
ncbi:beta family protein [Cohnella sp. WQ 127256]|uniref:beta family protein n=1 Tax=Cohnella sp. WQ 127256 TaxID=2938790 RepID=UPI0021188AB0|nr:beta family protein [Cohnella sp. WQ 127256]